jgi:hypothetical protein
VKRLLAVVVSVVALLAVSAPTAGADHSWGGYHWARTSNPFAVGLGDNTSGVWVDVLQTVSGQWSQSTVLDTPIVAGGTDPKKCTAGTGKIEVCNARYGFNGWLGRATINLNRAGHIVKARAQVNDTYFATSTYNDANARLHVLCQEVGHALGLNHQYAPSCMDDRNGLFDAAYVAPNAHDYQQLVTIYSHTDPTSTVASITATASASERVKVKHLPNGRLRITFTYPVDH